MTNVGDSITAQTPCKLCGGMDRRVVGTTGRDGTALTTVICSGCGLVHSHPIPTLDELHRYYHSQYRSDYKNTIAPKRKHTLRYARTGMERLNRLLPFVQPGQMLLDVGSGSGEFIALATHAGLHATGLEPHAGYATYSQRVFGVPVRNEPMESAGIAAESLDIITLNHVLEHLQYPLTALSTLNGWLKMGGILAVDVPDISDGRHSHATRFHFAHIYNFNPATLAAVLTKAGFTVEQGAGKASTSLIARKTGTPDPQRPIRMPDNYEQLYAQLAQPAHHHYLTAMPYARLWRKLRHYPAEYLKAQRLGSPAHIIQSVFAQQRPKPTTTA